MSDGVTLSPLADRERAWRERQDALLAPLVSAINTALGRNAIALKWNNGSVALFGHKLAVVDARTGKHLSVYMQPETIARRLELSARIIGADVPKAERMAIRYGVK